MDGKEKQILNTSDEVAKYVTNIEGWVDRNGHFWGKDERMARWSGCTHISCPDCGTPTSKSYTICKDCRDKKKIERYDKKERIKWDRNTPLYSEVNDEYFFDIDEIEEHIEENGCDVKSLRLTLCEPIILRTLETDYWCDELPEDGELSDDILNAIAELNRLIAKQSPSSWTPGKYAIESLR